MFGGLPAAVRRAKKLDKSRVNPLKQFSQQLRDLVRAGRKQVLIGLDICTLLVAYLVPWVMISGRTFQDYTSVMTASCFFFICCYEIVYGLMGMYDSLWRYAEIVEFFRLVCASVVSVGVFIVVSQLIFTEPHVPVSVYLLSALFATSLTLYSRLTYRMYRNVKLGQKRKKARRTLVIGAGDAASTLLHEKLKTPNSDMNIICCVDDDPKKVGRNIMGVAILGTTNDIPELVARCEIETILLAIPTLDEENKKRILQICSKTKCNLLILPDIVKIIADGEPLASRIRDVRVEDLLGRPEIVLSDFTTDLITDQVVMVTGGGGSIGSELCRQIAECGPRLLVIVDIYENNAYDIQQELLYQYGGRLNLKVEIASIRDRERMRQIFGTYRPDVVFHAAAHKHVPLMENSPQEAIRNNVFGTLNLVRAADEFRVQKFLLISTDKAVNPTSVMGASKRLCEMILQSMKGHSGTDFVAVRFGNVLGSNGSVVPLFQRQIAAGGTDHGNGQAHYPLFYDDSRSCAAGAADRRHGPEERAVCSEYGTTCKNSGFGGKYDQTLRVCAVSGH